LNRILKLVTAGLFAIGLAGCGEFVDPGTVGVKVDKYGSDKGVQMDVLRPGWYWTGFTYRIYEFPTWEQNYVFTSADTKESPGDESIKFQSQEGMQMSADFGLQYDLEISKVPILFEKYRKGVDEITRVAIRNMIRDSVNKHSTQYPVEGLIGRQRNDFLEKVESEVKAAFSPIGINIKNISIISEMRVPPEVKDSINAKLKAGQIALQRETEVQEAKAQAQKEIEKNRGIADSLRLTSQAEANAISTRGKALRENPEILQLNAVEKWNGVLPTMIGGSAPVPFISVPSGK